MDDIIVFASTLEEMEERLGRTFDRLARYGLKIAQEKCQLCCTSVKYIGHIVSDEGVQTDPAKVDAIKSWPRSKNVRQLRSFLGFCGYYRRFIECFSKISKPLHQLTGGFQRRDFPARRPAGRKHMDGRVTFGELWTSECDSAFHTLKEKMCTAPVLAFADVTQPFVLHTDASRDGLGLFCVRNHQGNCAQ